MFKKENKTNDWNLIGFPEPINSRAEDKWIRKVLAM